LKKRIDRLVVERGLAETREKAQALIMAGVVLVNDQPITKAGAAIADDAEIRLKEQPHPYVSRGGLKVEGAFKAFQLSAEGAVCVDIGSSTGGFTHFLLLQGAWQLHRTLNPNTTKSISTTAQPAFKSSITTALPAARVNASVTEVTTSLLSPDARVKEPIPRRNRDTSGLDSDQLM
jgi:ribosomal protein S4